MMEQAGKNPQWNESQCPLKQNNCPLNSRPARSGNGNGKEPMFIKFSAALISLLVGIVLSMGTFWVLDFQSRLRLTEGNLMELQKQHAVLLRDIQGIKDSVTEIALHFPRRSDSENVGRR